MQDFRPPEPVENSGSAPHGHTPFRTAVELRAVAARSLSGLSVVYADPRLLREAADEIERLRANQLSDVDRAVLDAADDYVTFIDQRGCSAWSGPTYDYMIAAVRARRETQP